MLYYNKVKTYKEKQNEKVQKIEKFFGKNIVDIAKECNFPEYSILVLNDDERGLHQCYPKVYNNILSCSYAADMRTPMEYAKDLVLAWVFEAYVMENLKKCGLDVKRNGGDKDLMILNQKGVNTDSDFLVNGKRVELISNYTNYWQRNGCFEMRDSKIYHLEDTNSLVIGVSTNYDKYLLIDFSKYIPSEYIESYEPFGGKPAHRITITKDMCVDLNFKKLAEAIKDKIKVN